VDKSSLLRKSLAKIMIDRIDQIKNIVSLHTSPSVTIKIDGSPVTALDLALSEFVENIANEHMDSQLTFYSEEKYDIWKFPLLALDPLDGTREFIAKRPEWSISIGLLETDQFQGEGWVYNPMTDECFSQESLVGFKKKLSYGGEVSRSEWDKGLFENKTAEKFKLSPMGSIAYKLGRLSAGKTDFVVSLRPKNIWDIAGGTLLCHQAGYKFYSQGQEVKQVQKLYQPPLIWCHESLITDLSKKFS
jgi:myo-inositol-1(or 4)-monophosphatase